MTGGCELAGRSSERALQQAEEEILKGARCVYLAASAFCPALRFQTEHSAPSNGISALKCLDSHFQLTYSALGIMLNKDVVAK